MQKNFFIYSFLPVKFQTIAVLMISTAAFLALFLFSAEPAYACRCTNLQLTMDPELKLGKENLLTAFCDLSDECFCNNPNNRPINQLTDQECNLKSINFELRLTSLTDSSEYDLGSANCSQPGKCEAPGVRSIKAIFKFVPEDTPAGPIFVTLKAFYAGREMAKTTTQSKITGGEGVEIRQVEQPKPEPIVTRLQVAIGGLTETSDIAEYIAAVFKYGISIVSTLVIAMIVWGGFKYLTARGDVNRISSAKRTLSNALIGLVLALTSYLILNTINPTLTRLKPITLPTVERRETAMLASNWCEDRIANDSRLYVEPNLPQSCGTPGTLKTHAQGLDIIDPNCIFKTCPAGQACARMPNGKYECHTCKYWTDDQMKVMGMLTGSDSACRQLGFHRVTAKEILSCVYANDPGIGLSGEESGCDVLRVECDKIDSCADYANAIVELGTEKMPLGKEMYCLRRAGNVCGLPTVAPHLEMVCNSNDPCGVGPCKTELTEEGKKLGQEVVVADRGLVSRPLYKRCVPE